MAFSLPTTNMNRMKSFVQRLLPLLAGLCFIQDSFSPTLAATTSVTVGDNFFSPANVTINVNDMVQWNWSMSEVNPHSTTSTSSPSLWNSGIGTQPFSFSHAFPSAGVFPYWCSVHTFTMTGAVTVRAANAPPSVAITFPTNNSTFIAPWTGSINVTASDTDDSVSWVQFFAGATLLGTVSNPPVNLSLSVTNLAAGTYILKAVATDSRGASTTSTGVTIHVVTPSSVIGLLGNLAFGSLPAGQMAFRTLVITNSGTRTLNVSGISYPPAFSGAWSGSIAPASSQSLQVVFSPTDQASYGGTLVVSNDAASGAGSLPISGMGYWPLTNRWTVWWQHTSGTLALWSMLGTNAAQITLLNPPSSGLGWRVVGTPDFNGNGQTDLLFESSGGAVAAWLMNSNALQSSSYLTPRQVDPAWQARGTADLNGNGALDILWQRLDGSLAAWLMNGLTATQAVLLNPPLVDPSWKMAGTGDFNGDSKSDILFRNTDGRIAVWFMNGVTLSSAGYLNPSRVDPSWRLAGSVDFNGDGHPGLLWEHISGALAYWQMAGTNLVHTGRLNPGAIDPAWQIVGPR
jgi:plastocyanin